MTEFRPPVDGDFNYKGVVIDGIPGERANNYFNNEKVVEVLDRFPDSYWEKANVKQIIFLDYSVYSAKRVEDGEESVVYVVDPKEEARIDQIREILGPIEIRKETDEIIARKRGLSINDKGKIDIFIFSTSNWDDKRDEKFDADNALFVIPHELGHATWEYARKIKAEREKLIAWAELPRTNLPRYLEYKDVVKREFANKDNNVKNLSLLEIEEEFAILHENKFYWRNSEQVDQTRHEILTSIYNDLSSQ